MGNCCNYNKIANRGEMFIIECLNTLKINRMNYDQFVQLLRKIEEMAKTNLRKVSSNKKSACLLSPVDNLNSHLDIKQRNFAQTQKNLKEFYKINVITEKSDVNSSVCSKFSEKTSKSSSKSKEYLIVNTNNVIDKCNVDTNETYDLITEENIITYPKTNNTVYTNDNDFKSLIEPYVIENLIDRRSIFIEIQELLLPNYKDITVENYKLIFLSWAIGFLNYENKEEKRFEIFLDALIIIYGHKPNLDNVKELIDRYVYDTTMWTNNQIFKFSNSNKNHFINGYYIDVELINSLEQLNIKPINKRKLDVICNRMLNLITISCTDSSIIINDEIELSKLLNIYYLRETIAELGD